MNAKLFSKLLASVNWIDAGLRAGRFATDDRERIAECVLNDSRDTLTALARSERVERHEFVRKLFADNKAAWQ